MGGVVLAAFLAAAALTAQPDASAAQPAKPDPPPLSIWKALDDGQAEHLQSGLRCPAVLGEHRLVEYRAFDGFGFDVGCLLRSGSAAITLYLTRTDETDESYEMAKHAVVQTTASLNPRLTGEERLSLDGLEWRRAVYSFDGSTRSDIWVAAFYGWTLKYRVTYAAEAESAVRGQILSITQHVRATAGSRLAACLKAKAPKRSGRLIDPNGLMSSPIMLAALMSQAAAPTPADGSAITYCVEEPFQAEGKGFLLWRGMNKNGASADADRVTAMTQGEPPILDIALDDIGNAITAQLSGRKQSRWIGTMRRGEVLQVYGFFDRRPSPQATIPLLAKAINGEAKPIGGFDAKDKTILIGAPGGEEKGGP